MAYTFDNYHHLGMENFDGGNDHWDFDHDGEMSIFEENSRRAYDQVMFDNIYGEERRSSDDWDEDEEEDEENYDDSDEENYDDSDEEFDSDFEDDF